MMNHDEILKYLEENPSLVDQYLNQSKLFHVYFRLQDPHSVKDNLAVDHIHLLKSFATQKAAIEWIEINGRDIVAEEEDDYGRPVVLTIIEINNQGNYCMGEIPSDMELIATKKYPTFAFSEHAYKMLLEEHKSAIHYDYQSDMNPTWITYYVNHDVKIKGVTPSDFIEIQNSFTYLVDNKKKKAAELVEFYHQKEQS